MSVAPAAATVVPSAAPIAAAPYCSGEYADDLARLAPGVRDLESKPYSYCVRNTATYECLSYSADGTIRRVRKKATMHGTAFGYRQQSGETLLLTNEHVAEWPAVTDDAHRVDGVPSGCMRVADSIHVVDNEADDYERDDIVLNRVVVDPQLDAAVLKAHTLLPVLPWHLGKSATLRERNVVEVRGFPLGAFQATNVGKVISAYDHDDEKEWEHDDFVIDALLSSGNSGSPVLAVSCKTGEFELVGLYHAGYREGSALNVVVGIDQLRDLMTTLKRTSRAHGDVADTLDVTRREKLANDVKTADDAFFPFGSLTATVKPRADGALVFEVFSRDFPLQNTPWFAYEDLPAEATVDTSFGEVGRVWFGGEAGVRTYARADLDADTQSQVAKLVDGLRRDALAVLGYRAMPHGQTLTRDEFETRKRLGSSLRKSIYARRDLAATVPDLADRLGPHVADVIAPVTDLMIPVVKTPQPVAALRAVTKDLNHEGAHR